jgi:hypothetical protein
VEVAQEVLLHQMESVVPTPYLRASHQPAVAVVEQALPLMDQRFLEVLEAAEAVVQVRVLEHLEPLIKDGPVAMQLLQMAQVVAVVQTPLEIMGLVVVVVVGAMVLPRQLQDHL